MPPTFPTSDFTFAVGTTIVRPPSPTAAERLLAKEREAETLRMRLLGAEAKAEAFEEGKAKLAETLAETLRAGEAEQARLNEALRQKIELGVALQRKLNSLNEKMEKNEIEDLEAEVARLQKENDEQAAQHRQGEADRKSLVQQLETRDLEISQKDLHVSSLEREVQSLKEQLAGKEADLAHAAAMNDHGIENLEKLNADVKDLQDQRTKVLKEAHDWQMKAAESEDKLASLRAQWDEEQERVEELEAAVAQAAEFQRQFSEYEQEVEMLRGELEESQRAVDVRNQRITKQEVELQKTMEEVEQMRKSLQKMQDKNAADATDALSPIMQATYTEAANIGDSLEQEMDALGEAFSDASSVVEPENLVFSNPLTTIDVSPVVPAIPELTLSAVSSTTTEPKIPTLSFSSVSATTVEPKNPVLSISSVSTAATKPIKLAALPLSISEVASTVIESREAVTPKLSISGVSSTIIDSQAPITPALSVSGISSIAIDSQKPIAPELSFSNVSSTDIESQERITPALSISDVSSTIIEPTAPVSSFSGLISTRSQSVETVPQVLSFSEISTMSASPRAPKVVARLPPPPTKGPSLLQKVLVALFGILCAYIFACVSIWNEANTSSRGRSLHGAYGSGGYLFNTIPVGFNIGHTNASEKMSRVTATVLQTIENWVTVDRTGVM